MVIVYKFHGPYTEKQEAILKLANDVARVELQRALLTGEDLLLEILSRQHPTFGVTWDD